MLPWPPDKYRGPFPPLDPRLPLLAQAHESAVEGFRRADETQQMQHHAMASYADKNAPMQTIHEQRLGLQGAPDGGMMRGAPVAMDWQDTASDEEPQLEARNPFHRGRHQLFPGLVAHANVNTMLQEERRQRTPGDEDREDHPGKPTIIQDTRNGARAGWRHMRPVGEALGGAAAATAVGLGYMGAGLASLGINGIRGAGHLLGHVMRGGGEDPEEPEPPPRPPHQPPSTAPPAPLEERPAQPVPPYLLDLEERMRAARRGPNIGAFAQREIDRRRIERDTVRYRQWM